MGHPFTACSVSPTYPIQTFVLVIDTTNQFWCPPFFSCLKPCGSFLHMCSDPGRLNFMKLVFAFKFTHYCNSQIA